MSKHTEPTRAQIEREAQELRIFSGYKVTLQEARDRVCDSLGWVNWAHMLRCKTKRGAA